jgi:hypothetical protein
MFFSPTEKAQQALLYTENKTQKDIRQKHLYLSPRTSKVRVKSIIFRRKKKLCVRLIFFF